MVGLQDGLALFPPPDDLKLSGEIERDPGHRPERCPDPQGGHEGPNQNDASQAQRYLATACSFIIVDQGGFFYRDVHAFVKPL